MNQWKRASELPNDLKEQCQALADKAAVDYLTQLYGWVDKREIDGCVRDPVELRKFADFKRSVFNAALTTMGFVGPPGAVIMSIPDEQVNKVPVVEQATAAQQAPASAKVRKFPLVQTPHGEWRDGTVTFRVYQMQALPADKALTLAQMHEKLCAEFATGAPGASTPDQLMITLRCQLQRQGPARGFTLGRGPDGKLSMHIEGYDRTRILSPEAKAEKEAKAQAKAAAQAEKDKAKAAAQAEREAAKAKAKAEKEALEAKAKAEREALKAQADALKAKAQAEAEAIKAKAAAEAAALKAKKDADLAKIQEANAKAKSAAPAKKK
jgi:chemotaxis protein histidine kinase CheA